MKGKRFNLLRLIAFAAFFCIITAEAYAQKINLNFQQATIKVILREITKQTGYTFVYSNALSEVDKKVDFNYNSSTTNISDLLAKLFAGNRISYKVEDKQVTIAPRSIAPSENQNKRATISGKITDDAGEPLVGVAVKNETAGIIAISDIDGNYSIVAKEGDRLSFSLIGMETWYATAGKSTIVDVPMKTDVIALGDVVVTGYQTISKERATGSFDNIGSKYINKPQTSIVESLVGNVAGLQRRSGNSDNLVIRGITSLGSNASPLLVVDGFAIEGSLSSLNPNDIASISVLKDAAAASIWGARSANGVIVVTTKTATKGKIYVELNSFVKFSGYFDLDYANPAASSAETIEYEKLGYSTRFFNRGSYIPDDYSSRIYNRSYRLYSQASVLMNENRLGYVSESEMNSALNALAGNNNKSQIRKYLMAKPLTQQYNLNISGGTEKINNFLSLMYENSIGDFKGNKNSKYTINYRNTVTLYKWLDFNFSSMIQYTEANSNGATLSDIKNMSPYDMLVDNNGNYLHIQKDFYLPIIQRRIIDQSITFPYSDWIYNPAQDISTRNRSAKSVYGRIQAGLKFKIIKGLTLDSKIQYELIDNRYKYLYNEDSYLVRSTINRMTQWDGNPATKPSPNYATGMAIQENNSRTNAYNIRNQLNFDRTFAEKHTVSVIAGSEVRSRVNQGYNGNMIYGYDDDLLQVTPPVNGVPASGYAYNMFGNQDSYDSPTYPSGSRYYYVDRYFSMYANASYTFNRKYTISGSVRTDASNLISSDPSIKYSPFWSVGALWNVGEEKFIKEKEWIDRLLVRATYGYNGNVDKSTSIDPLIYVSSYNRNYDTYFGWISNYGNPYLGWEKTGTFDLGIDYSFFKGKLFGKLDIYDKEGRDLIARISTPNLYGTSYQNVNAASMYNRGIELTVGTSLSKGNFNFSGSLNLAYNKNKITKLYRDAATLANRTYGGSYGYTQGYDANTIWVFKYGGTQEVSGVKQPVIVDKNGENPRTMTSYNTSFDSSDYLVSAGTSTAPYIVGLNGSIGYKNLNLSFIISGYFGHKFLRTGFNYPAMSYGVGDINKYYSEVKNCDPDKFIPLPDFAAGETYPRYLSDYYKIMDNMVCNAGNIRFQEINLSYNLAQRSCKKIGIGGLSIYGQLNNVGVILFNKYGQDPLYSLGMIKPSLSYTLGFKFKF